MTGLGKGIARSYSVENGYPGGRNLLGRRESRLAFFTQENCDCITLLYYATTDIKEITEDEAVLMESLQDEAANSKIKLSLLIKISNSLPGLKNIIKNLEVSMNENPSNLRMINL